jgi:hypothetical protein
MRSPQWVMCSSLLSRAVPMFAPEFINFYHLQNVTILARLRLVVCCIGNNGSFGASFDMSLRCKS